jgi:Predicted membrane protein
MTVTHLLFGFSGREKRLPWWIATILVDLGLGMVYAIFGMPRPSVFFLLLLAPPLIWISVAVQVKRWHDRDKSGWWFLMNFVPIIGWLWVLIECGFLRGTPGPNRFGDET